MLQKASNCFHDALANGHPESSPLSVLDVLPFDDSPNCQTPFSGCSTIRTLQKQNLCGEPMAGRPGLGSSRLGRSSWNTSPSLRLHQLQFSPCRHRNRVETRTAPGDFSRSSSLSDPKVLLATNLKRTASLISPDLFGFEDHFEFQAVIGRSSFSEVYKVKNRRTDELFAVKRSTRRFSSKNHRERCMREIMAVAALPANQYIVGQYRAWQQSGHFYIQMDLCQGGSLSRLLHEVEKKGKLLDEDHVWQVLWDVAQGLEFLHAHGVLHLDIKPDNIYRDEAGTLKIGDFGLAILRKNWADWEEGDGDYVAPELLSANAEPSTAADVYSLGASLFECATGKKLPKSCHEARNCIDLPGRSAALQWIVRWILNPDPLTRPSAADIIMQVDSMRLNFLQTPRPPPCTMQDSDFDERPMDRSTSDLSIQHSNALAQGSPMPTRPPLFGDGCPPMAPMPPRPVRGIYRHPSPAFDGEGVNYSPAMMVPALRGAASLVSPIPLAMIAKSGIAEDELPQDYDCVSPAPYSVSQFSADSPRTLAPPQLSVSCRRDAGSPVQMNLGVCSSDCLEDQENRPLEETPLARQLCSSPVPLGGKHRSRAETCFAGTAPSGSALSRASLRQHWSRQTISKPLGSLRTPCLPDTGLEGEQPMEMDGSPSPSAECQGYPASTGGYRAQAQPWTQAPQSQWREPLGPVWSPHEDVLVTTDIIRQLSMSSLSMDCDPAAAAY